MKRCIELIEKHCSRTLNEPLLDLKLHKEQLPNYSWSGSLKSKPNGRVALVLDSKGIFKSLFLHDEAGTLVPDKDRFTLQCRTESGFLFNLKGLFPQRYRESPISGIEVEFEPDEIEMFFEEPPPSRPELITGVIPSFRDKDACYFDSPLGAETPFGAQESESAWFKFERENTKFALGRDRGGFRKLNAWKSIEEPLGLRTSTRGFLYALSFYVGERLDWLGFVLREGERQSVCLKQPVPPRTALQHGPRPTRISESDERHFLSCAFDYFVRSENLPVVNWLSMLWDSVDNFFPIQCLVAATVVEGLARRIVGDDWNEAELKDVDALKEKVMALIRTNWAVLSEGHLSSVVTVMQDKFLTSTKNVGRYFARELVKGAAKKVGVKVSNEEVSAWLNLRNPLAHGNYGSGRRPLKDVQATSRQLDCTINLFYKLVYGEIGYRGPFVDFGKGGWPTCEKEAYIL